jgi:hypothetical protein
MLVEVHLFGEPSRAVAELAVARAWADTRGTEAVSGLSVRDLRGEIPVQRKPDGEGEPDGVFVLGRPAEQGELAFRYRADGAQASTFGLHVGDGQAAGVGHSFLLLPRTEEPLSVRIRWHLDALGKIASGASSFGAGSDPEVRATTGELAHAVFVAGRLTVIDGAPGERVVALGDPSFDPRAALAAASKTRAAAERLLDPTAAAAPPEPFTALLVAGHGFGDDGHDGASFGRSLGLWFGSGRPLDAKLRIVLAHELLHRWFGGVARLEDADGRDAAWFSEGFTVHYARRLLLDEGMITPADFAGDLRRTFDEGSGGGRDRPGETPGAACAVEGRGGSTDGYRRGALYAASLDAALRRAGRRRLDDLVRDLLARARDAPSLPVAAFRELVVAELGPAAGDDFDRLVVRGEAPIVVPPDAFGPCFRPADEEERRFDLGFDPRSLTATPSIIHDLAKGSAASMAGVTEGALVLLATSVPSPEAWLAGGRTLVDLTLANRQGGKRVRYEPVARRHVSRWRAQPCR